MHIDVQRMKQAANDPDCFICGLAPKREDGHECEPCWNRIKGDRRP